MGKLRWERILAITAGSSMPVLSLPKGRRCLQKAAAVGAVLNIDIDHPLERPADAGRRRVVGCVAVNHSPRPGKSRSSSGTASSASSSGSRAVRQLGCVLDFKAAFCLTHRFNQAGSFLAFHWEGEGLS